jgi:hypothetical protein
MKKVMQPAAIRVTSPSDGAVAGALKFEREVLI